jgi:IS605 OrfB family transposase
MKLIRSTKVSLKETNPRKLKILEEVFQEYGRIVNLFIELFWENPVKKSKLLKPIVDSVLPTWLSARLRKVAAREALDLVLSAKRSAKALGKEAKKPIHRGNRMCVSSTIASLDLAGKATSYDRWLHLHSIGHHPEFGRVILDLPIKLHKHYNELASIGRRQESYILTSRYVQLSFEIVTEEKLPSDQCIGIDSGIKALASTSTRHQFGKDIEKGIERIKRCKHGSKGQKRARRALRQRMNEVVKELFDTLEPTLIVVEKLRSLNKGTRVKRRLTKNVRRSIGSWTYRYWLERLERECEVRRSRFRSVNPYKTSQRCSVCGHIDRRNRRGEVFKCRSCDHTDNADINAALNILDRFLTGPYGAGCKPLTLIGAT